MFFTANQPLILAPLVLTPEVLAEDLAYNTWSGTSFRGIKGLYDWNWMASKLKSCGFKNSASNWPSLDRDGPLTWRSWDSASDEYKFMARVEESLNLAIYYVASALNWVISGVPSFTCKYSGAGGAIENVVNSILSFVGERLFFYLMTYLAGQGLVYVLASSSKGFLGL